MAELEQRRWWGPALDGAMHPDLDLIIAETLGGPLRSLAETEAEARYLLLEELTAPNAVAMYVAADALLGRVVVLKILDSDQALPEARAAALVHHPNVVDVHELARFEGHPYLVFAYCEGPTLLEWSRHHPWRNVLARVLEVGDALSHCHRRGLVHGDVKPSNILITQDRAVLADFGLAGPPDLIESFGGTPGYIAPELTEGRRSPAVDVYALACTAWMCLVGERPHAGKSAEALLIAARERRVQWPAALPPGMPAALILAIARGLEPEQRRRPSLDEWLVDVANAGSLPTRRAGRRRRALTLTAVAMLGFTLGVAFVSAFVSVNDPCYARPRGHISGLRATPTTTTLDWLCSRGATIHLNLPCDGPVVAAAWTAGQSRGPSSSGAVCYPLRTRMHARPWP